MLPPKFAPQSISNLGNPLALTIGLFSLISSIKNVKTHTFFEQPRNTKITISQRKMLFTSSATTHSKDNLKMQLLKRLLKKNFHLTGSKIAKTGFQKLPKKNIKYLKNGSNDFANFFSKLSSKLLLTISAIFRKSYKRFFE